ncbi:hypothetical protein [Halobacteriovorax sp. HLS]|uniref:hypothetical protein n=1 Tax=Halobacteriovorax sp. HLS TaxID=2234000 RepID=UPI000FDA8BC0|nr:hypothetical protein [Halobacteriovorax sp. HLS]
MIDNKFRGAIKILIYLFFIAVAVVSSVAAYMYPGSWILYMVFSFVSTYLLYLGFRRDHIFFDSFIGVFLWLGFWLKMSVRIIYLDSQYLEEVGHFTVEKAPYENLLLVIIVAKLGLIVFNHIRRKVFFYKKKLLEADQTSFLPFYSKYRVYLWSCLIIASIGWAWFNLYFGIYQRGMIPSTILPFGMNGIIKWLVLFGGASVSAMLISFEIKLKKEVSYFCIILAILETFISSVSMFSRGMILNSSALIFGGIEDNRFLNKPVNFKKLLFTCLLFVALFGSSVYVVNYLRHNTYINSKRISLSSLTSANVAKNFEVLNEGVSLLFLDRWVGAEAAMATTSHPDLGWDLFKEALSDSYERGKLGFYDRVMINSQYRHANLMKNNFISIPGAVSFFYYPGSKLFLFFAMFCIGGIGFLFEWIAFRASYGSLFMSSLVGQIVAYRFSHFGYVPKQSYLLFGTLLANMLIVFVLLRLFNKLKK